MPQGRNTSLTIRLTLAERQTFWRGNGRPPSGPGWLAEPG